MPSRRRTESSARTTRIRGSTACQRAGRGRRLRAAAARTPPGSPSATSWYSRSGPRQALQLVLAEVAELEPPRGAASRSCGGLRDEHLAAVPRRADPGGPMDVEADVPALGRGRLARMDAHPDAERGLGRPVVAGERALCVGGGTERRRGTARTRRRTRRRGSRSRGRPSGPTASRIEAPVIGHHRGVVVTQLLDEARRCLHVGEEERDGADREIAASVESYGPAGAPADAPAPPAGGEVRRVREPRDARRRARRWSGGA